MNTISSVSNSNFYNPQITNKVAGIDGGNLANQAANQSAFSSYIGQALAQIGVANPTNISAPVVSSTNKANTSEKSLSTFVQDLFDILSGQQKETTTSKPIALVEDKREEVAQQFQPKQGGSEDKSEAIAAYNSENSTTVGNIVINLKTLVNQLNDENRNTSSDDSSALQKLKNGFQSILDAQGANTDNKATLGNFLQTLAQNLEGQSPLGIIINTYS